ncbi:MAG: tyrosine protein phosphatase [Syntrophaceae bacterium]|nr:tyrosine protein phosphatase [Syntrophaceae bacterium]
MFDKAIKMIDLHTHILPGLDDGAQTLEESIEMCRISHQDGVRTVVATPHILPGIYKNDRPTILSKLKELNDAITKNHSELRTYPSESSLTVLPGADVHFSSDLFQRCEKGEVMTVNDQGRYLMVEFIFQGIPHQAEEVLFQLIAKGIIPIISHPERNMEIGQRPKRYYEMVRMGCLGQVTAMSLIGDFGSEIKRVAERLLSRRLLHTIASDSHSVHRRPPILSNAVKAAAKIVGKEEACKMVTEYPEAIIEGRRPDVPEPIEP